MSFSASLSKLKAFLPVGVVGACVAITIKLLTAETPTNSLLLKVEAEEDIKQVEHEEQLEESEEPPVPEEEVKEAEDTPLVEEEQEEGEEEIDDSSEGAGDSNESEKQEESQKTEEEEEKQKGGRMFGNDEISQMLKSILDSK